MLTLQVHEKEIENLTPEEEFVRGTVGAKCQINFDEFWQSYNKYIVFKRVGYEPINFMVDTLENEIEIPYTILAESGEFKIGVFGTTETETLPTLYSKDIKILYGTDTHGTTPPTYIPNEIDQLRLSKQDKLVSGENIKYINGESILGRGNIEIQVEVDQTYNPDSTNAQSGTAVAEALSGYVVAEVGKGLSSNDFTNADKEKLYSALQGEDIDQTYSPTSANAQSGKAVAKAIDPRTVYQKFIDDNKLKQRNWVDLSFVGGEYYYTDFLQAVADVNADTTVNSTTDSTNAVCQIFKNDEITVLRLLSDLSVTTELIFEKSVIFDINGYTVSLTNNAVFGEQITGLISCVSNIIDSTLVFYGAKIGSKIISTDCENTIVCSQKHVYILGGEYKSISSEGSSISNYNIIKCGFENNDDTLLEIFNVNMTLTSNVTSGANSKGIMLYTRDEKSHYLTIYNTKIYGYSTNVKTYSVFAIPHATVKNPNISLLCEKSRFINISPANLGDSASIALQINAYSKIKDCYIEGMASGIENHSELYLNNCICKSPTHGGLYNVTNGVAYLINSEFHRNPTTEGYTPTGTAAAYFGYGSIAYIDSCSFILDIDGDTSDGIAIKQGSGTIPTKVLISNSELPKLRCDSGQYVYLGEGISDTIRNTTVGGTKVLTDDLYSSYIEE